jgi:hypothetical protein
MFLTSFFPARKSGQMVAICIAYLALNAGLATTYRAVRNALCISEIGPLNRASLSHRGRLRVQSGRAVLITYPRSVMAVGVTSKDGIEVVEHDGVPEAQVSCDSMWDLVEYLSFQRMHVKYDFKQSYFTVSFPNQSRQRTQEILDEWSARRAQRSASPATESRDVWME